jgi:2,4-dienoyl-CoA reductase (NADPH2)
MKQVEMVGNVNYERVSNDGIRISHGANRADPRLIEVDTIVLCTGQESLRTLQEPLEAAGMKVHVVGGADVAAELDAKRAIRQASWLAAEL